MSDPYKKPRPTPSPESTQYWGGITQHHLMMPHCDSCGNFWFPAGLHCPHCGSTNHEFKQVSGRGRIYSYVIFHRVYHPAFVNEVPYVVALIELEEGPRMLSNIVGMDPERVECDMPVVAVFEDVVEGLTLPKFAVAPQDENISVEAAEE